MYVVLSRNTQISEITSLYLPSGGFEGVWPHFLGKSYSRVILMQLEEVCLVSQSKLESDELCNPYTTSMLLNQLHKPTCQPHFIILLPG